MHAPTARPSCVQCRNGAPICCIAQSRSTTGMRKRSRSCRPVRSAPRECQKPDSLPHPDPAPLVDRSRCGRRPVPRPRPGFPLRPLHGRGERGRRRVLRVPCRLRRGPDFGAFAEGALRGVGELRPAGAKGRGRDRLRGGARHRGRGLGAALGARLTQAARNGGTRRLHLRCLAGNRGMRALARASVPRSASAAARSTPSWRSARRRCSRSGARGWRACSTWPWPRRRPGRVV